MKKYISPKYTTKMQLSFFLLLIVLNIAASDAFSYKDASTVFICPDDITIGCCEDYTNTDLTGHPMMNNPDFLYFSYEDSVALNECREGFIKRTWTGYNGVGEWTCTQMIYMEYASDFNGIIHWPKDWVGSCADEMPFGVPSYEPGFCDQFAHAYQDDTIRIEGSVCMKILRNWKVIDWCKYNPNSGSTLGLWEHVQVLKIIELIKPKITSCRDTLIGAMNSNCTADFKLVKSAEDFNCGIASDLTWNYAIDIYNDWSVDSTAGGLGSSIEAEFKNIPIGTHKIMWTVYDNCGNANSCSELIEIQDGKSPVPFCYLSVPTVLMPTENMLEVNALMYIKKGEDNCSAEEDIKYSWSTDPEDSIKVFDCGDVGFQFLPIYSFDETGNYDFCFIFTRVLNHGDCSSLPNFIGGQISSFSGMPEPDVGISLGNNPLNTYSVDTSDQQGKFIFPYVETIANPGLYCYKKGGKTAGITTLDLILLNQYLLGRLIPKENSAFYKTADVNGDEIVNVADLIMMRDLILGLYESIQALEPIRMYIDDVNNPGHYIEIEALHELNDSIDIKIIRVGDIDGLFGPGN